MSIENRPNPPMTAPTPAAAPAPTSKQIRASALVDGRADRSKWKSLIPEALALWPKLHAEELANVSGNFHVLAGLVQLRHHLSREASDQQVRAFFDKHYPQG